MSHQHISPNKQEWKQKCVGYKSIQKNVKLEGEIQHANTTWAPEEDRGPRTCYQVTREDKKSVMIAADRLSYVRLSYVKTATRADSDSS